MEMILLTDGKPAFYRKDLSRYGKRPIAKDALILT
jgi:hypothetical protein